jgi:hypothetical protein
MYMLHVVFNRSGLEIFNFSHSSHKCKCYMMFSIEESSTFQLLIMFMQLLHDVFKKAELDIFNFSQWLCNCYMMFSIEACLTFSAFHVTWCFQWKRAWHLNFSQCSCKYYMMFSIEACLAFSTSHNVYAIVTWCFQ